MYHFGQKCTGKGVIVEIGSWKGKSTMLLARGSIKNSGAKVYAVDTFEGTCETPFKKQNTLKEFKKNIRLAKVNYLVKPLVGFSTDIAKTFKEPIEILFIDGDHSYNGIIADINSWTPKLINNGWILFHDTSNNNVLRAVKEKIINSNNYSTIGFIGSIIFAKKAKGSKLEKFLLLYILFPFRILIINVWKNLPESIKRLFRKKRNEGG